LVVSNRRVVTEAGSSVAVWAMGQSLPFTWFHHVRRQGQCSGSWATAILLSRHLL
jgi:hypothetical protein